MAQFKERIFVHEEFEEERCLESSPLQWFCEPDHEVRDGRLHVRPEGDTDYWQRTHYRPVMVHDNGPFLYVSVPDDETVIRVQTRVKFSAKNRFDQAGLMIRRGPGSWVKTSVEHEPDGQPGRLGAVVTNGGWSDWSTQNAKDVNEVSFRITKYHTNDVSVFYNLEKGEPEDGWVQIRIARLAPLPVGTDSDDEAGSEERGGEAAQGTIRVGLYCCSPVKAGYSAHFEYLDVREVELEQEQIA